MNQNEYLMKFYTHLIVAVLTFSVLALSANAQDSFTDDRSVLRKRLSGDLEQLTRAKTGRDFNIRILTNEGRVSFRLRRVARPKIVRKRNSAIEVNSPTWSEPILFAGYLLNTSKVGVKSVTADIIGKRLRFNFFGPRRGGAYTVVQALSSSGSPSKAKPAIARRPSTLALKCGLAAGVSTEVIPYALEVTFPSTPHYSKNRVVEISTDGDFEYYAKYGKDSFAEIEATIHTASQLFMRQMGVVLRVKEQHLFTTDNGPFFSTDPFTLLTQFQTYTNTHRQLGSSDLYHLFTGKALEDNVVGFSYVGQTCVNSGRYAYGITQRYILPIQALITAHEIGHSLGADHPEEVISGGGLPNSLMTGIVHPGNSILSEFSVEQIASYIDSYGSCLVTAR